MNIDDEGLPQSIRYVLLKTAYPKITQFNPACSSELLSVITKNRVPENVSLLFLHIFGTKEQPTLSADDIQWMTEQLADKPALLDILKGYTETL